MAGRERSTTHPPLTDCDRRCGGHGTNGSERVPLQRAIASGGSV